jgi:hypothetical protein
VRVPFTLGRTDASQEQSDVESFTVLEPKADGFRNYLSGVDRRSSEELLVDRAQLLTLTAPEMTALVGGLRVLGANFGGSKLGVSTDRPETLTDDFFVNLLNASTSTTWEAASDIAGMFVARDRTAGEKKWAGTGWTSLSVRTRSAAHWRRPTQPMMRSGPSWMRSWRHGARSCTSIGSAWRDSGGRVPGSRCREPATHVRSIVAEPNWLQRRTVPQPLNIALTSSPTLAPIS